MLHSKSIYCAPLQGYTDAAWRNAHHRIFGGVDCYLGPFMRIDRGQVRRRDVADASPDANTAPFVPQIIACAPAEAVRMATLLRDQGHARIDVNLGCPFPPVALRHKGAGMLKYPAEVEAMVAALCGVEGVQYSVKMRLGWDDATQWRQVLPAIALLNPVEVAVHPRTGRQQYKGSLLTDEFSLLYDGCQLPLVFNGGIKSLADVEAATSRWPRLSGLMVGRGLVEDPAMLCPEKATMENYRALHDELMAAYAQRLDGGDAQLLGRMKALWELMLPNADRKARKLIHKATTLDKYRLAVSQLWASMGDGSAQNLR